MKARTYSYTAGFFDAEGSFTIGRSTDSRGVNYSARTILASCHRPAVKQLVKVFGGQFRRVDSDKKEHTPCYYWNITSAKTSNNFLSLVLPYLRCKKKQAEILLEYLGMSGISNPEARQNLYERMRDAKNEIRVTTETPTNSKLDFSYLAGFFDGEGTASIIGFMGHGYQQYATRVFVTNTDLPILKMYQELFGGSIREHGHPNKLCYRWELRKNAEREKFLLYVLPYLDVKYQEANAVLKFLRLGKVEDRAARKKIHDELKQFKQERMIQSRLNGDVQESVLETTDSQDSRLEHDEAKTAEPVALSAVMQSETRG